MSFGKTKTQKFGNRVKNGSKAHKEMKSCSLIFLDVAHPIPYTHSSTALSGSSRFSEKTEFQTAGDESKWAKASHC